MAREDARHADTIRCTEAVNADLLLIVARLTPDLSPDAREALTERAADLVVADMLRGAIRTDQTPQARRKRLLALVLKAMSGSEYVQ